MYCLSMGFVRALWRRCSARVGATAWGARHLACLLPVRMQGPHGCSISALCLRRGRAARPGFCLACTLLCGST